MIKRGLISAVIMVTVSILVIEQRKSGWTKAGGEIHDATAAVGHAISGIPVESWDAARRPSGKAWADTKKKSGEAWKKGGEGVQEGLDSIVGKESG